VRARSSAGGGVYASLLKRRRKWERRLATLPVAPTPPHPDGAPFFVRGGPADATVLDRVPQGHEATYRVTSHDRVERLRDVVLRDGRPFPTVVAYADVGPDADVSDIVIDIDELSEWVPADELAALSCRYRISAV
jgi:hypothetical protein